MRRASKARPARPAPFGKSERFDRSKGTWQSSFLVSPTCPSRHEGCMPVHAPGRLPARERVHDGIGSLVVALGGMRRAVVAHEPAPCIGDLGVQRGRSEEHTSELQPLMRIPYAVFCWKKKNKNIIH